MKNFLILARNGGRKPKDQELKKKIFKYFFKAQKVSKFHRLDTENFAVSIPFQTIIKTRYVLAALSCFYLDSCLLLY